MNIKEGDVVEYNNYLYFVVVINYDIKEAVICPVNKIDLFGSDKDRLQSLVKHSFKVYINNIKLNDSGRIENIPTI
jgi:translation elongation factor EF-1alpha